MPKCPHCGEPVDAGQETCFACGQKVRRRRRQDARPTNPLIFVGAGAVMLIAAIGIIVAASGSSRNRAIAVKKAAEERVKDSVRKANRARQDTIKKATEKSQEERDINDELNKQDDRLRSVMREVIKDKPTEEQARLIGLAQSQLGRLRQVAGTMPLATTTEERERIKLSIRDGERQLRGTISDLTRAPKARTEPPAGTVRGSTRP